MFGEGTLKLVGEMLDLSEVSFVESRFELDCFMEKMVDALDTLRGLGTFRIVPCLLESLR